jgi:hypothetical protein
MRQHENVVSDVGERVPADPEVERRDRGEEQSGQQHREQHRDPEARVDAHTARPGELRQRSVLPALGDQESAQHEKSIDADVPNAAVEQAVERLGRGVPGEVERVREDHQRRGQKSHQVEIVVATAGDGRKA